MNRLVFYSLLVLFFLITIIYGDKKIRKDQYCKEGLFYQMFLNKCTPRDFLLQDENQENI